MFPTQIHVVAPGTVAFSFKQLLAYTDFDVLDLNREKTV